MFPRMFFGISAERETTPLISERNFGFGCGVGLENSLHLGIGKVLSDSRFQWCSAATKFLERKGETEQVLEGILACALRVHSSGQMLPRASSPLAPLPMPWWKSGVPCTTLQWLGLKDLEGLWASKGAVPAWKIITVHQE